MLKQRIHRRLANSAEGHNANWYVEETGLCTMRNQNQNHRDHFLPDIGIWFQMPTKPERVAPIKARCPLPNVWIEVNVLNFCRKNVQFDLLDSVSIIIRSFIIETQIIATL